MPPTLAIITPRVTGALVTAPTTYTVRIGGNSYIPHVSVEIDTYNAGTGIWSPIAGPVLTDSTGTAVLTAPLSGVGFFQIVGGGTSLGLSQIPYDTTGGSGPGVFPAAPTGTPPATSSPYPTGTAAKGAITTTAPATSASNVIQMPAGIKTSDPQFVPVLNDRLRQLAQATSAASSGGLTVGTHAARLATSAAKAGLGAQFLETDPTRNALYYVAQPSGGAFQWRLAFAMGTGTLADRPADLNALDVGFAYLATDTTASATWSGSAWAPLDAVAPLVSCTHAQRIAADPNPFDAANYANGQLLFETDRGYTYRALTARWIYYAGVYRVTAAALNALVTATTDPLTSRDTGALFYTTDYGHLSRYNESGALEWAPGAIADRAGSLLFSATDPTLDPQVPANAWLLCAGGSVTIQNPGRLDRQRHGSGQRSRDRARVDRQTLYPPLVQNATSAQMEVRVESPFPAWAWPSVWQWAATFRDRVFDDSSPQTLDAWVTYAEAQQRLGQSWAVWRDGDLGGFVLAMPASISSMRVHCVFKRDFWGRETTQTALQLVLTALFSGSCTKVISFPFADNLTVLSFLKRLGFRKEGRLRQQTLRKGQPVDLIAVGILKEEFYATIRTHRSGDVDPGVNLRIEPVGPDEHPNADLHSGPTSAADVDGEHAGTTPDRPERESGPPAGDCRGRD